MLPLLAVLLFVFLAVAAVAVDLSALERRGQTLQNTADAASLAAVATWQETGDPLLTRGTVDDLVRQNGLTGDDIEVDVFTSDSEVRVVIRDTEPDVFLGSIIPGSGGTLLRDASARLQSCNDTCNTVVELPAPFPPTSALRRVAACRATNRRAAPARAGTSSAAAWPRRPLRHRGRG